MTALFSLALAASLSQVASPPLGFAREKRMPRMVGEIFIVGNVTTGSTLILEALQLYPGQRILNELELFEASQRLLSRFRMLFDADNNRIPIAVWIVRDELPLGTFQDLLVSFPEFPTTKPSRW